eukprot:12301099-Karenia_brevis.AAC.1
MGQGGTMVAKSQCSAPGATNCASPGTWVETLSGEGSCSRLFLGGYQKYGLRCSERLAVSVWPPG